MHTSIFSSNSLHSLVHPCIRICVFSYIHACIPSIHPSIHPFSEIFRNCPDVSVPSGHLAAAVSHSTCKRSMQICPSIHPSILTSICQSVHPSICPSIYPSVNPYNQSSIHPPIDSCHSIHPSIHSIHPSHSSIPSISAIFIKIFSYFMLTTTSCKNVSFLFSRIL